MANISTSQARPPPQVTPLSFALSAWLVGIAFPFVFIRTWADLVAYASSNLGLLFQAGAFVIFVTFIVYSTIYERRPSRPVRDFFALSLPGLWVALWCLISSFWSLDPAGTILYSMALFAAFICSILFWQSPKMSAPSSFYIAGIALSGFLILLLALNGFNGRTIGWVHPNNIGKIAFAIVVLGSLASSRPVYALQAFGVAIMLLVSSRGLLLATSVFLLIQALLFPPRSLISLLGALVPVPLFAGLVLFLEPARTWIYDFIDRVLAISDASRGIGSGFTGRTTYWQEGLSLALERPILGYGFRTRGDHDFREAFSINAHSGFINIVLDIGIVGLASIFLMIALSLATSAHMYRNGSGAVRSLGGSGLCFFPALAIVWTFEPNYFNFGLTDFPIVVLLLTSWSRLIREPTTNEG